MQGEARPAVSIVIPVFNAAETLSAQLDALSRQQTSRSFEIMVADNGSTDETREIVLAFQRKDERFRAVDASGKRGVSYARNVGVGATTGAVILVCDADDVVLDGWVEAMAEALEKDDIVGGAFDEHALNDEATMLWRSPRNSDQLPRAVGFLPYAVGANVGFTREVFDRLQGWDKTLVGGGDDVDFSWRAQLAGFSLGHASDAIIAYRHRSELVDLRRQFYRYGLAGPELYRRFRKHGARRRPLHVALKSYLWLLVHVADRWGEPERRGNWIRASASLRGRLIGSFRSRVLYL